MVISLYTFDDQALVKQKFNLQYNVFRVRYLNTASVSTNVAQDGKDIS